ncbi:MAG: DUF935 family protein [bacterium]|nr:DUF935 family protein [bacterium]
MILDMYGNPVRIERKSLGAELASFSTATGQVMQIMPDPDPVLRKRGDDARVLADLAADDQVTMAIQLRKRKVQTKGDYDYSPGQPDKGEEPAKAAAALCDALTSDLAPIKLKNVFNGVLDANFYGYSVFELFWRPEGKLMRLAGMVEKPREWFGFDGEGRLFFSANGQKQYPPYGKLLVVRHEPTYANPYGLRLLSRCLWPVAFKQAGSEWCMRFLEKYGMPWQVATAPTNYDQKQRQQLASSLAAMVQDAVAVLPAGSEHKLEQASGDNSENYLQFLHFWNAAIAKVLSCQTQSSELTGSTGSYASAKTHYEVLEDVATADEQLIVDAMNDLAVVYAAVNGSAEYPPVFAFNEPEDYDAQAELDKKRYAVGVRFTKAHFQRYGLSDDEFYMAVEAGMSGDKGDPAAGEAGTSEFAAGDDPQQQALDAMIARALPRAIEGGEALAGPLRQIVLESRDYEEIEAALAELLGRDLDPAAMGALLTEMLIAAELYGRFAASEASNAAL